MIFRYTVSRIVLIQKKKKIELIAVGAAPKEPAQYRASLAFRAGDSALGKLLDLIKKLTVRVSVPVPMHYILIPSAFTGGKSFYLYPSLMPYRRPPRK
jgi:hypothetical protein